MNKEESIQQIETLIEAWQLDEADLNQTDINAMQSLLKENQMLKEKFKATNKGLQKVVLKRKKWKLRYQLARCEIKELKKQLEEYKDKINWYENFEVNKTIDKLRLKHNVQQKEFIKCLEDMLDDENDIFSVVRVKDVLQKYKEIIGGNKDEK